MIFVPLGYKNKRLQSNDEVHGGSAYGELLLGCSIVLVLLLFSSSSGAGTLAGDGSRQPSELELELARTQGYQFGKVVKKLAR